MSTLMFTFTESNRKVITKNWIRRRSSRWRARDWGLLALSIDLSDRRLCQRWNKSISWRGKSINKKIIILPLTSVDWVGRKRVILKKCDINRNHVPPKTRTITPTPLLNSRVTKEDTLQ